MLLLVAAVVDQIRRPADERTWTGNIAVFPYDLRIPTIERARERWWNPDDERIFTPKIFGVGWEINMYQVLKRFNLVG
ncbi:MAG TPA: DUF5808 domain-containing protein [Nitrolancea sp.]|jgi:uncharacterized membrane protein|nr:DUF5808 domain-containing protein [Nitrolancea sp.]